RQLRLPGGTRRGARRSECAGRDVVLCSQRGPTRRGGEREHARPANGAPPSRCVTVCAVRDGHAGLRHVWLGQDWSSIGTWARGGTRTPRRVRDPVVESPVQLVRAIWPRISPGWLALVWTFT